MLLNDIQQGLAALYETPIAHCVDDFLITDAGIAHSLESRAQRRTNNERLLLRQSSDSLDITLYIDHGILESLAAADPFTRLDAGNLNDFLIALEGVSHFNYLIWNAAHARQITQLEMELQAEVDKYVTATMLFDEQGMRTDSEIFHDTLFEHVLFDDTNDALEEQRYRAANHYAGKYCKRLVRRFPAQHREQSFVNELRRFYRLSQNEKIRLIDRH